MFPQPDQPGHDRVDVDLEQFRPEAFLELAWRRLRQETAFLDETNLGAPFRFIHVMGRDKNGDPAVAQVVEQIPDLLAMDRVEAGGRFVQKQKRRIVYQRTRHCEHLAHAAGEFTGHGAPLFLPVAPVLQDARPDHTKGEGGHEAGALRRCSRHCRLLVS